MAPLLLLPLLPLSFESLLFDELLPFDEPLPFDELERPDEPLWRDCDCCDCWDCCWCCCCCCDPPELFEAGGVTVERGGA